jgi:hypothetical protein
MSPTRRSLEIDYNQQDNTSECDLYVKTWVTIKYKLSLKKMCLNYNSKFSYYALGDNKYWFAVVI